MSCNIHLFTEKKIQIRINDDPKWFNTDRWEFNPYYIENIRDGEDKYRVKQVYDDQDYDLFSILADVRNHNGYKPISQPKGLPEDVTDIVNTMCNPEFLDVFARSYLTIKELYDYYEKNKGNKKHPVYMLGSFIEILEKHFKHWGYNKEEDSEKCRIIFCFCE